MSFWNTMSGVVVFRTIKWCPTKLKEFVLSCLIVCSLYLICCLLEKSGNVFTYLGLGSSYSDDLLAWEGTVIQKKVNNNYFPKDVVHHCMDFGYYLTEILLKLVALAAAIKCRDENGNSICFWFLHIHSGTWLGDAIWFRATFEMVDLKE
jgi:hypothetical protein